MNDEIIARERDKTGGSTQSASPDEATAKPRLLALDDVVDSAELISRMAEKCGYDAQHITEPRKVGSLIRTWQPSLLVTDICMPTMDAIEMFKLLKESGFAGDVFIVSGQSSFVLDQTAELAAVRGINIVGSMRKPVDIPELRAFLTDRLNAS